MSHGAGDEMGDDPNQGGTIEAALISAYKMRRRIMGCVTTVSAVGFGIFQILLTFFVNTIEDDFFDLLFLLAAIDFWIVLSGFAVPFSPPIEVTVTTKCSRTILLAIRYIHCRFIFVIENSHEHFNIVEYRVTGLPNVQSPCMQSCPRPPTGATMQGGSIQSQ